MATTSNSGSSKAHGEKAASFEENFARLQEVVTKLSEGNLTLQDALNAYEEGMALASRCATLLDQAELRVKQVSDRALKAGSAGLADLDLAIRDNQQHRSDELVAIEIESFETTLVLEDPPAAKRKPAARPAAQPLLDELDPLFDDD